MCRAFLNSNCCLDDYAACQKSFDYSKVSSIASTVVSVSSGSGSVENASAGTGSVASNALKSQKQAWSSAVSSSAKVNPYLAKKQKPNSSFGKK